MSDMTLINMSITAVPLICAVVFFRFLTVYKLPKKTLYVMWGIVSAQLLIPYDLFARFDISAYLTALLGKLGELFAKAPEAADSVSAFENPMLTDTANTLMEYDSSVFYDIFDAVDRFGREMFGTASSDIVNEAAETAISRFDISPILLMWITGFMCFSVYFIVTHVKFRKMYEEALPIDSTFIRAWRVEYSDSLRRKVRIKQSDMITSPLTYGIAKPVILLPCDTDYSDETTLRYVLYHEYTHIWRFDTLSKLILTIALCVHWFNPFVWVMYMLANRDIELSCDENVVRNITSGANAKSDYAYTLIKLAEKKRELALSVSFSRNVMRERIKSIMKTKKKSLPRIIAGVILVSMVITMVAALQSCDSETDANDYTPETNEDGAEIMQLDESFVMQEQTDKLLIHAMSMTGFTLTPAVNIFKEMYPDVDVEIITFNDDEYETILRTELAAGKGPDLIFSFGVDLPDVYKTMATEMFVDLNQLIGRDDDFNLDDYVRGVIDSVLYNGKRYIMPIEYGVPILVSTQEIFDDVKINSEDVKTFNGFLQAVLKYHEKYKNNPDKSIFFYGGNKVYLRSFLMYSDIELIDYKTKKVTVDKAEFKNIMDALKTIYDEDEEDTGITTILLKGEANLINQSFLFNNFYTNPNYMLFGQQKWILSENLTPVISMFPNINDGVTAEIQSFAAIPQASQNQINAYNLLKIILSEEIQGGNDEGYEYLRIGNPVLKSAVRSKIERESNLFEDFDEAIIDEYTDLMINVNSAKIMPHVIRIFVIEEMTPYFESKRSFDDCYDRLVNKLEIYISE